VQKITIRDATIKDTDLIIKFIYELAKVEKAEHKVEISREQIIKTIFEKNTTTHTIICELDGYSIGHAIYFFNYSTSQGKNGLYIEDIYISSEYRNLGIGKEIIKYLSSKAIEKDCCAVEFAVFNRNTSAIGFYKSLGAQPQDKLILYRFSESTLKQLVYS